MTRRLLVPALAAAAACAVAAPAAAVEHCERISPTFIDRWTICAGAETGSGTATVYVTCDLAPNPCQDVRVTVP